jgi:hypothetical protein
MRFNEFCNENYVVESTKSIEEFYAENGIDSESLMYLGKGDFGTAYSIGDGRVLKETTSKREFGIAKELEGTDSIIYRNAFALVYRAEVVGNRMFIILEELRESGSIERMWSEMEDMLSAAGLPVQYLDNLDPDDMEEMGWDISDELQTFMNGVEYIIGAYRHLGIEASDVRPENLGYDKGGNLKGFDIDDRAR